MVLPGKKSKEKKKQKSKETKRIEKKKERTTYCPVEKNKK